MNREKVEAKRALTPDETLIDSVRRDARRAAFEEVRVELERLSGTTLALEQPQIGGALKLLAEWATKERDLSVFRSALDLTSLGKLMVKRVAHWVGSPVEWPTEYANRYKPTDVVTCLAALFGKYDVMLRRSRERGREVILHVDDPGKGFQVR